MARPKLTLLTWKRHHPACPVLCRFPSLALAALLGQHRSIHVATLLGRHRVPRSSCTLTFRCPKQNHIPASATSSHMAVQKSTLACRRLTLLSTAITLVPQFCFFAFRIACRSHMHACKNGKREPSCGWSRIPAEAADDADSGLSRQSSISSSHQKRGSIIIPSF